MFIFMLFKQIVGVIQIIFSLMFIVAMVLGLTVVKTKIKEGVGAGGTRIPSDLQGSIDLSILVNVNTAVSVFFGVIGILFLLQGLVNLKKEFHREDKIMGNEY